MRTFCVFGSWMLLVFAGCGSPVVDPGRVSRPIPVAPVQPTVNEPLPSANSTEIPQVPAESILSLPGEASKATYHTVKTGESLSSVAKKYGVSVEKLRSANGLDASASLKAQQLLFIPRDR